MDHVLQLSKLTSEDARTNVPSRLRAVAAALPDTLAVAAPGAARTFAQLESEADAIARALCKRVPADLPIAMLLPHGVSGLVGLIGLMKTGRPVVPLDPAVPAARLAQIVRIAGARACLTDRTHATLAQALAPAIDTVVQIDAALSEAPDSEVQLPEAAWNDVAVIVFTSGSTGTPKGVAWTHGTLLNEAYAGAERLGFSPADRMALALPYTFAAGLTVLVFALLNGAGAYAYDPRDLGVRDLVAWVESQKLTTLHVTPSLLRSLLGVLAPGQVLGHLRLLATCGEPVHGEDIAKVRPHLSARCCCVNWAGASEIGSLAFYPMPAAAALPDGPVPAGVPAAGKEVALYREDGTCAELGETGEVVVTSAFTAAGYWRADQALSARFTIEPDGRRTYRSGDLGRWDASGVLTLLGRRDAAVKVRGYLVEPGEIEAALRAAPVVSDAVVLAVSEPPGANRLVAYVVPKAAEKVPSAAALRRLLRTKLPTWMVPATIVWLPELPRNERGKVDRLALPTPPRRSQPFSVPTSEWELVLADLWLQVLQLEEISTHDDFIELGGDSLAAAELLALVADKLQVVLPSSALVDAPTLAEFAVKVANAERSAPSHPTVVSLRTTGTHPPLFCFAGAGGLGLGFLSLARHLGENQPVYAFQAHGLEQRAFPDWSVERHAARHVQMMRVLAPRGPYLLVGHSLGGLIAMEAAHQLKASGAEVALLALLDSYLPSTVHAMHTAGATPEDRTADTARAGDGKAAARGARNGKGGGPWAAQDIMREVARTFSQRLRPEKMRKMALAAFTGVVQYPGNLQFEAFYEQGRVLERFYRPRPWDGRSLVVRALDNPDPEDAWTPLLRGPRRICHAPTVHLSLLNDPHVAKIADALGAEIAQVVSPKADDASAARHPDH